MTHSLRSVVLAVALVVIPSGARDLVGAGGAPPTPPGPSLTLGTTKPFELILLGTGYPRPDPQHAGPSTAVVAGGEWFVVDAGRGTTMRIAGTDLQYDNMRAVFLTHPHSD